MTTHNQSLCRYIGELGIAAAHITSAGTTSLKLGADITCAVGTNTYECTFPGFKVTPNIIVQQNPKQTDPCLIKVVSKSTSTASFQPFTIGNATTTTNGGTATIAAFDVLIMGPTYL